MNGGGGLNKKRLITALACAAAALALTLTWKGKRRMNGEPPRGWRW